MNEDSVNEREPKVMTFRPGGPRDGEVILVAVVSVCESTRSPLPSHLGERVRESGVLSSCMGSA